MREITIYEAEDVNGGLTNLQSVVYSSAAGTGLGALLGYGTYGSVLATSVGGFFGCMMGAGFGTFIVFSAAAIKFATSETTIYNA